MTNRRVCAAPVISEAFDWIDPKTWVFVGHRIRHGARRLVAEGRSCVRWRAILTIDENGASDGARTRDLRRDRPAL